MMSFAQLELVSNYILSNERDLQQLLHHSSPSPFDSFFAQEYEMMNRIKEELIDECSNSMSPYSAGTNDEQAASTATSSSAYSTSSLTTLDPYKPDSDSSSLIFTRMVPVEHQQDNGSSESPREQDDRVTLQQVIIEDHDQRFNSPIQHHQPTNRDLHPIGRGFDAENDGFGFVSTPPAGGRTSTSSSSSSNYWSSTTNDPNESSPSPSYWLPAQNEIALMQPRAPGVIAPNVQQSYHQDAVAKECVVCGMSASFIWWPDGTGHYLCGPCKNNCNRPVTIQHPSMHPKPKHQRKPAGKKTNQVCTNCKSNKTSLWRRKPSGETVCNACGLYFKLHKRDRPMTMRKDTIQKRKRKSKTKNEKDTNPLENGNTTMDRHHAAPPPSPSTYSSPQLHIAHRGVIIDQTQQHHHHHHQYLHPMMINQPHVHSPDGFRNPLLRYDSPRPFSPNMTHTSMVYHNSKMLSPLSGSFTSYSNSSPSASPPTTPSSYLSQAVIPSPSPSPSPTMTTLLPSPVANSNGIVHHGNNDNNVIIQHSFIMQSPAVSD